MRFDDFCATRRALMALATFAAMAGLASAQSPVSVAYLQGKAPVAPDAISVLGPDLFGDKINLYNGSFSFEHTDVELPGNSALRVAVVRQHSPGRQLSVRGAMADWDLSTPRIEGSFADLEGWVPIYGSAGNRCSSFNMPPYVTRGRFPAMDFSPDEYWQGTSLVVPGYGSQEILVNAGLPSEGGRWNLATRNLWQVGCLPTLQNAAGQGFIARSPEGVTYRFDWMAVRDAAPLRKGDAVLARRDMFLMATRVTDRFGNWVDYRYNAANPLLLERIEASDGRVITLQYTSGRVSSVHDGTRTWQYQYSSEGDLQHVVLPDGSRWTFSLGSLVIATGTIINEANADCDTPPSILGYGTSGFMVHPSGAKGTFYKNFLMQGRTNVQRICTYHGGELANYTNGSVHPRETVNEALERKVISGPGMPDMVWEYWNGNNTLGEWAPCTTCADRKTVIVVEPSGAKTRHTFGIRWRENEGQLLRVERADASGNVLQVKDIRYRTAAGQCYPDGFGSSVRFTTDLVSTRNRPEDQRITTQYDSSFQNPVAFSWEVAPAPAGFDCYARPLLTTAVTTGGPTRSMLREYIDFAGLWVMGQTRRVTEASTGLEVEKTDFYESTGLPSAKHSFGRLTQSMEYHSDGLLHKLIDPAGKTTVFAEFNRGQPQRATFADGTFATQVVNNLGNVAAYTNEVGTTTSFEFDAMGRVSRIIYPTGDDEPYCDTYQYFTQNFSADREIGGGHWKQTISTCNARTERWFDGFWRIRLERKYDSTNPGGTATTVETRYDSGGRKAFQSYPVRDIGVVNAGIGGVSLEYDAMDRIRFERASSEPNSAPLVTETRYESDFKKRVINPRGFSTTYSYQTFDEPSEDSIKAVALPENATVSIARDVFGKALSITRSGPGPNGNVSVTRSYSYDGFQRLCKTVEPETGATIQGYDASGNLSWRVSGQAANSSCDRAQQPT
jgi:YD repeat-containing protein